MQFFTCELPDPLWSISVVLSVEKRKENSFLAKKKRKHKNYV